MRTLGMTLTLMACGDAALHNQIRELAADPLYAYDADAESPYTGEWPVGACADDVGPGEGYKKGDVIPDFSLMDQFGDTVHIRDFCNRTIAVYGAAFW